LFQYHKEKLPTFLGKYVSKLDQKHKYETRLSDTKNMLSENDSNNQYLLAPKFGPKFQII